MTYGFGMYTGTIGTMGAMPYGMNGYYGMMGATQTLENFTNYQTATTTAQLNQAKATQVANPFYNLDADTRTEFQKSIINASSNITSAMTPYSNQNFDNTQAMINQAGQNQMAYAQSLSTNPYSMAMMQMQFAYNMAPLTPFAMGGYC